MSALVKRSQTIMVVVVVVVVASFFCENSVNLLIIVNRCTNRYKIIKITSRSLDHLATTTYTDVSWRCAAVLALPSLEPGKTCRSRKMGSCCAKAPKTQHTRASTVVKDDNLDRKRLTWNYTNIHENRPDIRGSVGHTTLRTLRRC
jgi:hypothetical protein